MLMYWCIACIVLLHVLYGAQGCSHYACLTKQAILDELVEAERDLDSQPTTNQACEVIQQNLSDLKVTMEATCVCY